MTQQPPFSLPHQSLQVAYIQSRNHVHTWPPRSLNPSSFNELFRFRYIVDYTCKLYVLIRRRYRDNRQKEAEKKEVDDGGDGGVSLTVVLRASLHCEGCAHKVKRSIKKHFNGMHALIICFSCFYCCGKSISRPSDLILGLSWTNSVFRPLH